MKEVDLSNFVKSLGNSDPREMKIIDVATDRTVEKPLFIRYESIDSDKMVYIVDEEDSEEVIGTFASIACLENVEMKWNDRYRMYEIHSKGDGIRMLCNRKGGVLFCVGYYKNKGKKN